MIAEDAMRYDPTRINPLPPDGRNALIPGFGVIWNLHCPDQCAGQRCTVHRPSAHHMRAWPMAWEARDKVLLRICGHDIEHPDPDDRDLQHPCDGCCRTPTFNEGFTPEDLGCPRCREVCRVARVSGGWSDLLAAAGGLSDGHLLVGPRAACDAESGVLR